MNSKNVALTFSIISMVAGAVAMYFNQKMGVDHFTILWAIWAVGYFILEKLDSKDIKK